MPVKKTRRQTQPRRTHNLGGCATCRRRHVKCDQMRPSCTVCLHAGVQCEGFPPQIRWASVSTVPSASEVVQLHRSTAAVSARQDSSNGTSSSSALHEDDQPKASLQTVAAPSPPKIPLLFNQGPNTNFTSDAPTGSVDISGGDMVANESDATLGYNALDMFSDPLTSTVSDLESPFDICNGLGWNDLFNSAATYSMPIIQEQANEIPFSLLARSTRKPLDGVKERQWYDQRITPATSPYNRSMCLVANLLNPLPLPSTPMKLHEGEVLAEAPLLLRHFRDVVISQFSPLPTISRSPWEVLNWSTAVKTHADMTFLQTSDIKHACKANLFAVLGCSAHIIMRKQDYSSTMSYQKGARILEYVSKAAKEHMQESLMMETSGPNKAKYKDQLMAIFSLIMFATLIGNSNDARCYLIDAERLLRLRGLAKRDVSRRARLLHHVYTWLRIIGESTFTMHDYESLGLKAKFGKSSEINSDILDPSPALEHEDAAVGGYSELDDFLRIESYGTDSDSEMDVSIENPAGLHNTHLAGTRQRPKTLHMDIYGIPELWLKLVSQTTRVANILDLIERESLQVPRAFTNSLQRKTNQLEHIICTLSAQHSSLKTPSGEHSDRTEFNIAKSCPASRAMLRALGSALAILFYRRIRKVHPWILQTHVNDVSTALRDFELAQNPGSTKKIGSPWPAFIAGCEAMSPASRAWFLQWMKNGAVQSACNGFTVAQQVLQEVWSRRDATNGISNTNADPGSGNQDKYEVHSWVDVLREGQIWLMLY